MPPGGGIIRIGLWSSNDRVRTCVANPRDGLAFFFLFDQFTSDDPYGEHINTPSGRHAAGGAPIPKIAGCQVVMWGSIPGTSVSSLAWEEFGEANGARPLSQMRLRIARNGEQGLMTGPTSSSAAESCRSRSSCPRISGYPFPKAGALNIVAFKGCSTDEPGGMALLNSVEAALGRMDVPLLAEGARYSNPMPVRPRLGQGGFRILETDSYRRQCSVSGERTLPALDAAHIRPYGEGGEQGCRTEFYCGATSTACSCRRINRPARVPCRSETPQCLAGTQVAARPHTGDTATGLG